MESDTATTTAKVAVITGASSGIGRATAAEFARRGYNIVLAARREQELRQAASECELLGARTLVVPADVTKEQDVQRIASNAIDEFGYIDIWINGAAVSLYCKFDESPMEDFRRVMETDFFGYINGIQAALKQFKLQGWGTLVNITSVNAIAPMPYASAYVASKHAVRGLSSSLRMELELDGLSDRIHISDAMPPSTDTNFFQNAANYTGRTIEALEPVYEASYIAKQIVDLAEHPRPELVIAPAGKVMVAARHLAPWLYEKLAARVVNRDHLGRDSAPITRGNLYESIKANTGTSGGWRETRLNADTLNLAVGAAASILALAAGASYMLLRRSTANHRAP